MCNTRTLISRNKREGHFAGKTKNKHYRKAVPYGPCLFKKVRTSDWFTSEEYLIEDRKARDETYL